MAGKVEFDFSEIKEFTAKLKQAAAGDFKKELAVFIEGLGYELLRIVQDEIMRRKVMDTRLMLSSFQKGGDDNVWEATDEGLTLEVGTNVKYAAFVNDGHWTNPKGVEKRFVPGQWQGDRFIYEPGAKTGMVLRQRWVEGAHYWESTIRIFETMFPNILEAKLQEWMDRYFGG